MAVGLAVDAGLYALAVYPVGRQGGETRAGVRRRRRRIWKPRGCASRAPGWRPTRKTRADAELRTFHQEILPRDLAGARALTFARLAALADDHGLLMERRASAPDRDEDSLLARLQVSMLLSGAYRDIRRFIHALETAPEFLIVEEIVLSQGDGTEAGEVLSLGLSTYYWHDDHSQRVEP